MPDAEPPRSRRMPGRPAHRGIPRGSITAARRSGPASGPISPPSSAAGQRRRIPESDLSCERRQNDPRQTRVRGVSSSLLVGLRAPAGAARCKQRKRQVHLLAIPTWSSHCSLAVSPVTSIPRAPRDSSTVDRKRTRRPHYNSFRRRGRLKTASRSPGPSRHWSQACKSARAEGSAPEKLRDVGRWTSRGLQAHRRRAQCSRLPSAGRRSPFIEVLQGGRASDGRIDLRSQKTISVTNAVTH